MDAISLALLSWSDYHDALPVCADVEEKLETALSELASLTKTDMCVENVLHFRDLYCRVWPGSTRVGKGCRCCSMSLTDTYTHPLR